MKQVRKFLDLSTGHLPRKTAEEIEAEVFPKKPAMQSEYAWLFSVPETIQELHDAGVTCGAFLNVMVLAQDTGCDYVLFDRDAEPVDWLPTFDW